MLYSDCQDAITVLQSSVDIGTFWERDVITEVSNWLRKDWNINFIHIPCERNNVANFLAKKASREGFSHRIWGQPPSFLVEALYLDACA